MTKEEFLINFIVAWNEGACAARKLSEYRKEGTFSTNSFCDHSLCDHFQNDCRDCIKHCVAVIFEEEEDLEEEG